MNFKQITFIFSILMIFSLSVIGQNKLLQAVFMDGISGAPPPRDIKKTENGDYIMLIEIGSADIVMKDVVVEPMEKPEMYTDSLDIGIGGNYLLVKISNNLDLVSWVQLNDIGNVIEMTYSHGKTFVNHETYHDNHYIMIDELPILRQNEQSVIMMFDEDLNYEGDILSIDDQNIEEMIADDEFIYGHISMKSNNNGDDNPMVIIGTDTLHNFTGYNSQEELSFPLQTAAFFKI